MNGKCINKNSSNIVNIALKQWNIENNCVYIKYYIIFIYSYQLIIRVIRQSDQITSLLK